MIKLLLLLFSTSLFTQLFAKEEITWFQHLRPPWMINSGLYKNEGYGDKIRQHFEKVLYEYDHQTIPINPSRSIREMKKRKNYCYGPIAKLPNFENYFYWSKPIYALPAPNIILLESTYKKLGSPKTISMEKLLNDKNYRFGQLKNISIYPINMKKYKHQTNIEVVSTMASTTNLLTMIQKKRIDWMYDSPLFITWYKKVNARYIKEPFKTIKAIESKTMPNAHIACIKNDFGKTIIEKVNQDLSRHTILEIRHLVRPWMPQGETRDAFDRLNRELYGY